MIIAFSAVFLLIALLEVPSLIHKRLWRELVVFSILFVFAFTVSLVYASGVEVPSPMMGIKYLIEDVLRLSYK